MTVAAKFVALTVGMMAALTPALGACAADNDHLAAQREHNREVAAELVKNGDRYLGRGDTTTARKLYERALVANPASVPALRQLGIAYQAVGAYTQAMKYCRLALDLKPDDVASLSCWGASAANREEFELALETYRKIKTLCKGKCAEAKAVRRELKKNFPVQWRGRKR